MENKRNHEQAIDHATDCIGLKDYAGAKFEFLAQTTYLGAIDFER